MNQSLVLISITGLSIFSLAAALIVEHVFGLEPCILCLYQRAPFAIIAVIGTLALLSRESGVQYYTLTLGVISFFANAVIAFYHTGVERHWWTSFLEGCAVPDLGDDPEKIMEAILAAPAVRCDEIPWADPILGLSMANYNVIWCLGLASLCLASLIAIKKS